MNGRPVTWKLFAVPLLVLLAAAALWRQVVATPSPASLEGRMATIVRQDDATTVPCDSVRTGPPLVLLALGQSNAGNHGPPAGTDLQKIALVTGTRCSRVTDPLPGATGSGSSIWQRLPAALGRIGVDTPVVMSVLAVESTSIDDWTRHGSPLRTHLQSKLSALRTGGFPPRLVLWQQGERDAIVGTSSQAYRAGLVELARIFDEAGLAAPILLADSTICRSDQGRAVREAIGSIVADSTRFRAGPDTDTLSGPALRSDGCHLSSAGQQAAAALWAERIKDQLPESVR